jgi:pyruvate formate lyase activating enzyme
MEIKGFHKNSFVDWDGRISCVIFLPGCSFRCGFCYNKPMVMEHDKIESIDFKEIENHLKRNRGFIDGVVVTGGEPTLHRELPDLLRKIKSMDISVKLDTNGSNPMMLEEIIKEKLVDYLAMDIKAPMDGYPEVTGVDVNIENIRKSIDIIRKSRLDYEFRTTIIPSVHGEAEIESMAKEISGAEKYVLQKFIAKETIDPQFKNELSPTNEYMNSLKKAAEKHLKNVMLRE